VGAAPHLNSLNRAGNLTTHQLVDTFAWLVRVIGQREQLAHLRHCETESKMPIPSDLKKFVQ
jgi:hypothetical protein